MTTAAETAAATFTFFSPHAGTAATSTTGTISAAARCSTAGALITPSSSCANTVGRWCGSNHILVIIAAMSLSPGTGIETGRSYCGAVATATFKTTTSCSA